MKSYQTGCTCIARNFYIPLRAALISVVVTHVSVVASGHICFGYFGDQVRSENRQGRVMDIRGLENLSDQISSSGSEDFKCQRYRAKVQSDMQLRRMEEAKLAALLYIFIL
jgi:hypothetical protein